MAETKLTASGEQIERGADSANAASRERSTSDESFRTWRLVIVLFYIFLALFLSTIETSIVSTALVGIASTLGDYDQSNWIVNAYMLGYTGFLMVYARLSDTFGRKSTLLIAIVIFGAFSLGCSLAQTMQQLIVLRAFQGMGASGIYAMAMTIPIELVSFERVTIVLGAIVAVFTSASILGPTLGGAIANSGDWRWVFRLNVPAIPFIFVFLCWFLPPMKPRSGTQGTNALLRRIDWLGILLAIAGSILTVFALQSAGTTYAWGSGIIIGTLSAGVLCFAALAVWEDMLSRRRLLNRYESVIPIFPIRLARQRIPTAAMITAFLTGFPFQTTLVLFPQRLQITNALSPLAAGQRFIAILLPSAFGSVLGGCFRKKPIQPWIVSVVASSLLLLGMGLMSTLDTEVDIQWQTYIFMIILGASFGSGLGSLTIISRMKVQPQDSAILITTLTQIRVLGGCIALAVATNLVASYTTSHLEGRLMANEIAGVLASAEEGIAVLSPEKQTMVREVYGQAWALQQKVMLGVSGAGFVANLFTFTTKGKSLQEINEDLGEWERSGRQAA